MAAPAPAYDIHAALAALPRPRKHYIWYYGTRPANADMLNAPQGVHAFLRAYYHVKSADWPENKPTPLGGWRAEELAKLPTYYVMDHGADMPATVAPNMPSADQITNCAWLIEAEMAVYAQEYTRTGFQGGLNWYRGQIEGRDRAGVLFSGRTIDAPACFISGKQDWGTYQTPGALGAMERVSTQWRGTTLIDGAGHWVQQERPEKTVLALLSFLRANT
jgi:pimeloyl-ACP methyl ester carboxylesterase